MATPINVKDKVSESTGIVTNVLMGLILIVGGWFGDSVLDNLAELNKNVTAVLTRMAVREEVDKHQNEAIKKQGERWEHWTESHLDMHERKGK